MKKYTICVGLFDKDSKRQEVNTLDAYKIACNLFARHTGGATITEGQGIYTHESCEIVVEPTLVCMVYGATLEAVETVASALKDALNQESVSIECADVNSWFF